MAAEAKVRPPIVSDMWYNDGGDHLSWVNSQQYSLQDSAAAAAGKNNEMNLHMDPVEKRHDDVQQASPPPASHSSSPSTRQLPQKPPTLSARRHNIHQHWLTVTDFFNMYTTDSRRLSWNTDTHADGTDRDWQMGIRLLHHDFQIDTRSCMDKYDSLIWQAYAPTEY